MADATTNPSVLRALADRCAKGGPSRELDVLIACEVLDLDRAPSGGYIGERPAWAYDTRPRGRAWWSTDLRDIPEYTSDFEAAMSLALDWMSVTLTTGGDQGSLSYVEVTVDPSGVHWSDAQGNTPALAICAALLTGRADADEWAMHFLPRTALADGNA